PSPTAPYTLSLHDALPILPPGYQGEGLVGRFAKATGYSKMMATKHGHNLRVSCINEATNRHVTYTIEGGDSSTLSYRDDFHIVRDRKSTRLNSSHVSISYA